MQTLTYDQVVLVSPAVLLIEIDASRAASQEQEGKNGGILLRQIHMRNIFEIVALQGRDRFVDTKNIKTMQRT